jgi:hypothetical protein
MKKAVLPVLPVRREPEKPMITGKSTLPVQPQTRSQPVRTCSHLSAGRFIAPFAPFAPFAVIRKESSVCICVHLWFHEVFWFCCFFQRLERNQSMRICENPWFDPVVLLLRVIRGLSFFATFAAFAIYFPSRFLMSKKSVSIRENPWLNKSWILRFLKFVPFIFYSYYS